MNAAKTLARVIPIGRHPEVFPRFTEARHLERGWVLVVAADGNQRRVRWYDIRETNPRDIEEEGVLNGHEITTFEEWVQLDSLRGVDPGDRPANWRLLRDWGILYRPPELAAEIHRRKATLAELADPGGQDECRAIF